MKKVSDLFDAYSSNLTDISMLENGGAGFRIPDYQRQYDWAEKNIERLYFDCLNGFHRLSSISDSGAFSFLGTLILVMGMPQEKDFKGKSISVVDGQQRLTTLTLLSCALFEALRKQAIDLDPAKSETEEWLKLEAEYQLSVLRGCAVGRQMLPGDTVFPFPRIVRTEDTRGSSGHTAEYKSPVAIFLDAFASYSSSDKSEFDPPALGDAVYAKKLAENYLTVRELVSQLNDEAFYDDTECEMVAAELFNRQGYRSILEKLDDVFEKDSDRDSALSRVISDPAKHALYRLLLFSSYITSCVVLTRVETRDESAAFDIFDSLNTTGEPLTAIETLKPQVIKFETSKGNFAGSDSETAFSEIAANLDELHPETEAKQRATKEVLIDFALYLEGYKLSKDLGAQRNYLRTRYDKAVDRGDKSARAFVQGIADTAQFRRFYWDQDGLEELGSFHQGQALAEVQLLCGFISKMNTSLALPAIRRYWAKNLKKSGDKDFLTVLRAITAFLILRRAATGTTAGIDGEFRNIMAPIPANSNGGRKLGLCAGVDHENTLLDPAELKAGLRKMLKAGKHGFEGRDAWVGRVIDNPLADQSKPLSRFLLLAAAHHAVPDTSKPGLWMKKGIKQSAQNASLNYATWQSDRYATVEHIAPESEKADAWDNSIYESTRLKHTLGNLVPLPAAENSAIGNQSWSKKKKFYLALTEESEDGQKKRIAEAKADGIRFSKATTKILETGERLPLLDPLRNVDKWNAKMIQSRSRNIAELAWDRIWPWLE